MTLFMVGIYLGGVAVGWGAHSGNGMVMVAGFVVAFVAGCFVISEAYR